MEIIFSSSDSRNNAFRIGGLAGVATLVGSVYYLFKSHNKGDDENEKRILNDSQGLQLDREPPGIRNLGNTCFINCVLQALASLPKFMHFVSKYKNKARSSKKFEIKALYLLEDILKTLNDYNCKTIKPSDLIDLLNDNSEFIFYREQQDCHEFIKMMMNAIDIAVKELSYNVDTLNPLTFQENPKKNPFNGYFSTILECTKCKHKYNMKIECFNDISLDITSKYIKTLEDSINKYFDAEYIEGVECIICSVNLYLSKRENKIKELEREHSLQRNDRYIELINDINDQIKLVMNMKVKPMIEEEEIISRLNDLINLQKMKYNSFGNTNQHIMEILQETFVKKNSLMKKYIRFVRLPKILCLHLKRVVMHPSGNMMKIERRIPFLEYLSIDNWLESKLFNSEKRTYYQLCAVIRHYGTESFGHYITYRRAWHESVHKNQDKSQKFVKTSWSFTSDDQTFIISKDEVFDCPAYLLFYEQIQAGDIDDNSKRSISYADYSI